MTLHDITRLILTAGTIPVMLFNGILWKEVFINGLSAHGDDIYSWIGGNFLLCSGFSGLSVMVYLAICVRILGYTKRKRECDADGDDGTKEGGDIE